MWNLKNNKDIVRINKRRFSSENTTKIAINILQGSVVTQNALGRLVIYRWDWAYENAIRCQLTELFNNKTPTNSSG